VLLTVENTYTSAQVLQWSIFTNYFIENDRTYKILFAMKHEVQYRMCHVLCTFVGEF